MSSDPSLKDEYIPFSWKCFKAERNFCDGNYKKALQKVEEMKEILENKVDQ